MSSTIRLHMEPLVLVAASLYSNKSLNTQAVTKEELPKYQAEQNSKYQIDSHKREIYKKLSAKADSLVDKILLVLESSSQIRRLFFWMVWRLVFYCQTLFNNFVVRTRTFHTFTWPYLALMVYLQLWFRIKMPKTKRNENMNDRSWNHCTRGTVLLMSRLCAI